MKTLQLPILLCAVLLLGGAVFAQQSTPPTLTFNIPVQLNNLHQDVTGIHVACNVYRTGNHIVGSASADIRSIPADGNVNQTLTLVVTQESGQDITLANSYAAAFTLIVPGNASAIPTQSPDTPVNYRAKAGTPFVREISGPIAW
jgi:hypothetical protein